MHFCDYIYRQQRQQYQRQYGQRCVATETTEEREVRLHSLRQHAKGRHAPSNTRQSGAMTKDRYLHDRGWAESSKQLHHQPWAQKEMMAFHKKQQDWEHCLCTICHELWPTRTFGASSESYICTRCKRDKNHIKKFSIANDMHPGIVPPCLQGLSQVEEMLIACACQ